MIDASSGTAHNIYQLGRLSSHLGYGDAGLQALHDLQELAPTFIRLLEERVSNEPSWQTKEFGSIYDFRFFRIALWVMVRLEKPSLVIETGVLHGLTSAFILHALQENQRGHLISVDLPSRDGEPPANRDGYTGSLPRGREPGWIVPSELRARWDLRLGSSEELLQTVKVTAGDRVLFLHDSDHSPMNVFQELSWASRMPAQSITVVCDNIESHSVFSEFSARRGWDSGVFPTPDLHPTTSPRFAVARIR